jgi:beta-glucanase (GH16 family)
MKKYYISLIPIFLVSCQDPTYNIDDYPSQIVFDPNQACISAKIPNAAPQGNNDVLVWAEEFDDDQVCEANWVFETIPPQNGGWFNGEQQYYTDRSTNASILNGVLRITAKKESYLGKDYTSARITTQDLFEFKYGKIQVRAKLPQGQGTWPAIWMLGANIDSAGWPFCGEIDIMEHGDLQPGLISSAIHQDGVNGSPKYDRGETNIQNVSSQFHVYEADWREDKIVFSVDGNNYFTYNLTKDMPFHQDFFIILNVAMGGFFVNNVIDPNFTSSSMEIDYVRVFQ